MEFGGSLFGCEVEENIGLSILYSARYQGVFVTYTMSA